MKQFILKNRKVTIGLATILLIGGITMSFQDSPFLSQKFSMPENFSDTLPEKNDKGNMKMKDFDKLIDQLDKTVLERVNGELKKIDLTSIQQSIENALKQVDMEKIMKDVELSIKNIDVDKIVSDVSASLKDIDLDKNSGEIKEAIEEARKEIENARAEIKDINMDEIRKEMEKAKIEIERSKSTLKEIDIPKIMKEAQSGIDEAKIELKQTKAMFDEMEKDGLISSKDGFTIEYKEKDLYINGTKQSEKVTDKYRKYFKEDHFKMTIDKE